GHLVFSTLHTNDAPSAVTRLQDMGIDNYLISSSVLGVMAQRLVRRICPNCKEKVPLTEEEAELLNLDTATLPEIHRGRGCDRCGQTGYRGRVGIYELFVMSDDIRHVINGGGDAATIRHQAIKEGLRTLRQDGLNKLYEGVTTPEEIARVTRY
ncbi:MAG: ATPase, T2SS/T4P/T4SS family, partial [Pseudomonadota bacterium]